MEADYLIDYNHLHTYVLHTGIEATYVHSNGMISFHYLNFYSTSALGNKINITVLLGFNYTIKCNIILNFIFCSRDQSLACCDYVYTLIR